ncbi:diaminopimelate epimerase [Gemmatimonadota bacterium]
MNRPFLKMSGAGNDFIVFDDRDDMLRSTTPERWAGLCARRTGIGADGVLMLRKAEGADFQMVYLNSNGFEADMCGNGARCLARAAAVEFGLGQEFSMESPSPDGWKLPEGIGSRQIWAVEFLAGDGRHHAIGWGEQVMTSIGDPTGFTPLELITGAGSFEGTLLDTGVPHFVTLVDDIDGVDLEGIGSEIRHHADVGPDGANANFLGSGPDAEGCYPIRTFERGVEAETLACGTGCAAAASVLVLSGVPSPIRLRTGGGVLTVHLVLDGGSVRDLWLEGPANIIYRGRLADI